MAAALPSNETHCIDFSLSGQNLRALRIRCATAAVCEVILPSGMKSLFDMGLNLFRHHLSLHPEVEERALLGILMVIEQERKGFAADRGILKSLLNMFSSIGIYDGSFQKRFLEDTAQFYREESERNLLSRDIPQYLLYCEVTHAL